MATAGAKVTIACKLPIAWLDLQLFDAHTESEATQTGSREITVFRPSGDIVRIRGTAYPRGTPPVGFPDKPQMLNGYALTPNVDKAFWDKWLEKNSKAPFVVTGGLMAFESADTLRGKTKEHFGELTGLEPMSLDKDPRMPAPSIKGLTVTTAVTEAA